MFEYGNIANTSCGLKVLLLFSHVTKTVRVSDKIHL